MGLLDFISKSTGDTQQSTGTTPTDTSTQQQTQRDTSQLSNVQYPIPTAPSDSTAGDYGQYTFDPSKVQGQEIDNTQITNQTSASEYSLPNDITQDLNDQVTPAQPQVEVEDLTQYGQMDNANPQPIAEQPNQQLPDLNALTSQGYDYNNYAPTNTAPQNAVQPTQDQVFDIPAQQEPLTENVPPQNTGFDINQFNQPQTEAVSNDLNSSPINSTLPSNTKSEPQVQASEGQPSVDFQEQVGAQAPSVDTLTSTEPLTTAVEADLVNGEHQNQVELDIPATELEVPKLPETDVVIGNEVNAPEMKADIGVNPVEDSMEESKTSDENKTTDVLTNSSEVGMNGNSKSTDFTQNELVMNEQSPNVEPEIPTTSEIAPTNENTENNVELNHTEEMTKDVLPVPVVAETIEEKPQKKKEKQPKIEVADLKSDYSFQKLKNIAFIGLNSKPFNNVSAELKSLSKFLAEKELHLLIDSNRGYGEEILSGLESSDRAKVTAVHFKPFYTNYTDENERQISIQNYTTVVYSDYLERFKYFIRESEAFIVPEISGLMNFSVLAALLSLQYLYNGQHKPVVLLGNKWSTKLDQFKTFAGLSDEEFNSIKVATTADEALKLLVESDESLAKGNRSKARKFYDYREDFDEYEYMN